MTKVVLKSLEAERYNADSIRERAVGDIPAALISEHAAGWHSHAMDLLRDSGERQARETSIVNGEAVPTQLGYLRDTLTDPDLVAIESSYSRGRMLHANDVVALGIDISQSAGASNTHEKIIAHEIALAHKVAMEQANAAANERDPAMAIKRLQVSARMMAMAQQGVTTLQKMRTGGSQRIVVQHVHVAAGGQAVVGNLRTGTPKATDESD